MTNASNTAALADAYAALKHEEKALAGRLDAIKAEIISAGETEIVGDTCIVALVEKKGATTMDKDGALALLRQLGATEDQIAGLMKTGKPSTSLMIKAKLALAM
jgi:hypothetical protein